MKRCRHLQLAAVATLVCFGIASETVAQETEKPWIEGTSHKKSELDAPLRGSSIAELAEKVSPTVVNVIVGYANANKLGGFFESTPFQSPTSAQGSGFIIHPTGYVLTNHHVVEGAETLKVRLWDDREFEVEVVGVDPQTDVALLKMVDGGDVKFPAAVLGDSDAVRVGENVLAIGNPLGLSHTVTAGIVSALERRDLAPEGRQVYSEFIQTDASINPGNSGGPLINLYGEVIGINTAINRQGQGIGFAIPINIVKTLIPHLSRNGYVVRTWLGIRMQEVTLPLAKSFGLDRPQGALVTEVIDSGPAEKAGLVPGDVILEFNGRTIRQSDMLPWLASTAGAEDPVEVTVLRRGKKVDLEVQLEEQPNQSPPELPSARTSEPVQTDESEPADLGVGVKSLEKSLARQLGAKDASGVVVTDIDDGSPAEGSGLRRRDVILEVGNSTVASQKEFQTAVQTVKPGEVLRLKVVRAGRIVYIAFER